MIQGPPGTPLPLQLTIEPGYTDRGVRAFVRKLDGTLVVTKDLTHIADGMYLGNFSHPAEEYLVATFIVYKDGTYAAEDPKIATTSKIYRVRLDALTAPVRHYENRMTTVFDTTTCEHEVVVWADRDGQRVANTQDAEITVKDSLGNVVYQDSAAAPNSDGVYQFKRVFKPDADRNFYVVISILVDGAVRTSHQSFFTLG